MKGTVFSLRKAKRHLIGVGILLVAALAAFVGGIAFQSGNSAPEETAPPPEPEPPVITATEVSNVISGIAQYSTLEYRYTNVGKFEDKMDFYGWQVPFTNKSFIITYDGAMKLGIDAKEIQVEVVELAKEIRVTLPPAQVLSHEIQEDTLEVMDQTKNIFNQIQIEDYASFATDQKNAMEEKARQSGMFDEASANAQAHLREFLQTIPLIQEQYAVVFLEEGDERESSETEPATISASSATSPESKEEG